MEQIKFNNKAVPNSTQVSESTNTIFHLFPSYVDNYAADDDTQKNSNIEAISLLNNHPNPNPCKEPPQKKGKKKKSSSKIYIVTNNQTPLDL